MSKELYKKHRPKKLSDIVGQDDAVRTLKSKLKAGTLPHFILFSGPSGCGKTTIARILRKELGCHKHDFYEINGADKNGVDDVRAIEASLGTAPMFGKCKIWLIDECHRMSSAAQADALKMLEDTPNHVYFFFATTDPNKLSKAIKTRGTHIIVQPLTDLDLSKLVIRTINAEEASVQASVVKRIVEYSEGSPRKALVFLNQIIDLPTAKNQLDAIIKDSTEAQAITIARTLMQTKASWPQMAKVLKACQTEDPEGIRRMVLGYAKTMLLNKPSTRTFYVLEAFADNVYDSGWAGIVANCYRVILQV